MCDYSPVRLKGGDERGCRGKPPSLPISTKIKQDMKSCTYLQELTTSLQSEEDKANRLSKTKIKLESAVHEAHDELEKEKGHRAEVEKAKRKIEGDLKVGLKK